jgi:hypothetical protein
MALLDTMTRSGQLPEKKLTYRFRLGWTFSLFVLLLIFLSVIQLIIGWNVSPYISGPHGLIHEASVDFRGLWMDWNRENTFLYFINLSLHLLLPVLFFWVYEAFSKTRVEAGAQVVDFRWQGLWQPRQTDEKDAFVWRVVIYGLFLTCLVVGLIESIQLAPGRFPASLALIHSLEVVSYYLALIALFYVIFKRNLQYFLSFFQIHLGYFLPSVISIVVLFLVYSSVDQTDVLILELVDDKWNFLLFSLILFPFSLVVVWYIPYYLMYSEEIYKPESELLDQAKRVGSLPGGLHQLSPQQIQKERKTIIPEKKSFFDQTVRRYYSNLFRPLVSIYGLKMRAHLSYIHQILDKPREDLQNEVFHGLRRFFAMIYIITLVYLTSSALEQFYQINWVVPVAVVGTLVIWIGFHLMFKNSVRKPADDPSGYCDKFEINKWYHIYISLVSVAVFILFLLSWLIAAIWPSTFWTSPWNSMIGVVIFYAVFGTLTFLSLAYYRRFSRGYTLKTQKGTFQRRIAGLITRLGNSMTRLMMLYLGILTGLSVLIFLIVLFGGLHDLFPIISNINTLNIYLLLVNGLLGLIAILERFFILRKQHLQQLHKKLAPPFIRFVALVLGFLLVGQFFDFKGNSYHEIEYITTNEQQNQRSLATYTDQFLQRSADRGNKAPVILIATDGGGLRAAYWNLLIMNRLDELGYYDGHVFLATGASGGCIGQGIYTLMKAQQLERGARLSAIQKIGQTNFLSSDFAGLLGRFPIRSLPDLPDIVRWSSTYDRMEAMAAHYFKIVGEEGAAGYDYERIRQQPFYSIWEKQDYQLPLLIVNTARAEDGRRGVIMPLAENKSLTAGVVDLSSRKINQGAAEYISYPDALFLTNRFPFVSPAAKVEGKGYFVDGGYQENSGLATLSRFLWYMKMTPDSAEQAIFRRFFEEREVIVLSIRNAKSRYVYDQFKDLTEDVNRIYPRSELAAVLGAASQGGQTGNPKYYDELFSDSVFQQHLGVDQFLMLDLPFLVRPADPHDVLQGQVADMKLLERVEQINCVVRETAYPDEATACPGSPLAMPPLGRVLSDPSLEYMQRMLEHPEVREVFEVIRQ